MYRKKQKIIPKIFLLICFLLNFLKLFQFFDKTLDFLFQRTQISYNLDTVDFEIIELNKNKILKTPNFTAWNNDLCVWFNFTKSKTVSTFENSPTLCLHGTINYAPLIFEHLQRWPNFISFALFFEDSEDFEALKLYQSMINCKTESRSFVSTHLIFNNKNCSNKNTVIQKLKNYANEINCFEINANFKKYLYKFNRYSKFEYPINSLRNIARFRGKTEFLVNSDIENIFSKNAHLILKTIIKNINQTERKTTAIVIRRFEAPVGIQIPENVNQLGEALKDKRIFNFHHQFYANNHLIPNFENWLQKSLYSNQTFVQQIKYQYSWEPLTVTHFSSPSFHEGLLYRYRNQIGYVYELCRAKFKFAVASHIFAVHKGIKKKLTRSEKFYLHENWEKAFKSWNNFEEMIQLKYPKTDKICNSKNVTLKCKFKKIKSFC